jgi:metal-responsive CopG/Arc/MetJ family transcriptional regulator
VAEEKPKKRVEVKFSEGLYARLERTSENREVDIASYIRLAVQDAIERDEEKERRRLENETAFRGEEN